MKTAKFHKILLLLTTFVLSIVAGLTTMTFNSVSAATASRPGVYFSGTAKLSFKEDSLYAEMDEGNSFYFINQLVVEDLALELKVSEKVEELSISLKTNAYSANGNAVVSGGDTIYKKEVNNVLKIKLSNSATSYSINENNTVSGSAIAVNDGARSLKIKFRVNSDHLLVASINEMAEATAKSGADKVERIDKTTAMIMVTLDKATSTEEKEIVKLISVDQKTKDLTGNYKQTFELDENGVLTDTAYPRVTLGDDNFNKDLSTGKYDKLTMLANVQKSYSVSVHSVLNDVKVSNVSLASNDADKWLSNETSPKKIAFGEKDNSKEASSFDVVFTNKDGDVAVIDSYKVTVIDKNTDTTAPTYIYNKDAYDAYVDSLNKIIYEKVFTDGKNEYISIALGTEAKLPSLRDLVYDDYTSYGKLDITLKYSTDENETQTSSKMSFKIGKAGGYTYYVIFGDEAGNVIDNDKFIKQDENDSNKYIEGEYKNFIFKFDVQDNAPISIGVSSAEGIGFKGIQYKASKFDVQADGCKTTYTLYYNESLTAEEGDSGWKEIPAAAKVTSEKYTDKDGNTYESVKAIGYDGSLTFTPTEYGSYMIKCVATSDYTTRTDSKSTILRVDKETSTPTYVKVPTYWLRDNVWSVVFLSVGTLSLAGIIVLLFTKPKDEKDAD